MSNYDRKSFFEVLGSFVPGYKGYSEKEFRRETDRILRDTIVRRLQEKKRIVEDLTRDFSKSGKIAHLENLESIRRRIDQISDTVRYAPQGFSGFFDAVQIGTADLDKLYRFDLGLREKVEAFTKGLANLPAAPEAGPACQEVLAALQDLGETARRRDEAITEVT